MLAKYAGKTGKAVSVWVSAAVPRLSSLCLNAEASAGFCAQIVARAGDDLSIGLASGCTSTTNGAHSDWRSERP